MNSTQIQCFLAVVETNNFTKAAAQLFISQPGLGKQIQSLERELNTLLFIRDKKSVRLTPAGAVLAEKLKGFIQRYDELVIAVQCAGQGINEHLVLGFLGGQWLGEKMTKVCQNFMMEHPNVNLNFQQGSFRNLREWVQDGTIDIAITLDFDIKDVPGILYESFDSDQLVLAVSKLLPI